jgi:UDP:flavonoid glycosyltransferase YjiC (YdhE family)
MRITILTYGSRGDVQPFIPLSLRLVETGHSVKLAAPYRFKNLIEENNIDFVPLAGDPEDLSRRLNTAGHNFLKLLRELMNHAVENGADIWHQTEKACDDTDLVIHTFTHAVGAHTIAREKNIPDIHIQTFPMFTPTGDYPNITMPHGMPRVLNRFTHHFSAKLTWWTSRLGFERVRRRAGLPKRKLYWPFDDTQLRRRTPILCAWSPNVLRTSDDWPPRVHVTGFYFFPHDNSYQPPAELLSFLKKGKMPICVTFGSMVNRAKERIDRVVRESLKETGNRGIILSGWSGVNEPSSNDLLYLEAVPHDWLLPHCKMIIHHGGAGTTGAGLRAGIPNIVVPFLGDQPFWGERVRAIGVGPSPILIKDLSIKKLSWAIAEAEKESFNKRAKAIGNQILSEDGTGNAAKWIEKYSNDFEKEH